MAFERVDLVVVGAGPAGLAAAAEAAGLGARVAVLDEAPVAGGRLVGQSHAGRLARRPDKSGSLPPAERLLGEARSSGAQIYCGVSVWGVFPGWFVGAAPAVPSAGMPAWGFDTQAVLVATGATQNALPLPGWTLPGVITAGAAQLMLNRHGILPGRTLAVVGVDPLALSVSRRLVAAGACLQGLFLPPLSGLHTAAGSASKAVADLLLTSITSLIPGTVPPPLEPWLHLPGRLVPAAGLHAAGLRLRLRHALVAVEGNNRVEACRLVRIDADGRPVPHSETHMALDTVILSAGLTPHVDLVQAAGCPLVQIPELGGWVPLHGERLQTPLAGLFVAGSVTGIEGAAVAEAQGRAAGAAAAEFLGLLAPDQAALRIRRAQAEVVARRRHTLAFLPRIAHGRDRMRRLWATHAHRNPFSPRG